MAEYPDGTPAVRPPPLPEDLAKKLRSLKNDLVHPADEHAHEVDGMVTHFERDAAEAELLIGAVPESELQEREAQLAQARMERDAEEAERFTERQLRLLRAEASAKDRVWKRAQQAAELMMKRDSLMLDAVRGRDAALHRTFARAETTLRRRLAQQQGVVRARYGSLRPSTDARGPAGGAGTRHVRVEWTELPQPIEIYVEKFAAAKNKMPAGRYVLLATVYSRLGGMPLRWSRLGLTGGLGTAVQSGASKAVRHRGRFFDTELPVDQCVYGLLPSPAALKPSNVIVLELFMLGTRRKPMDRVVAWTALPACDSDFHCISGKFKLPLLRGEFDPAIDRFHKMEHAIAKDLDRWLCNVYVDVRHLPRTAIVDGQRVQEYDAELSYTSELLNLSARRAAKALARAKAEHKAARDEEHSDDDFSGGSEDEDEELLSGSDWDNASDGGGEQEDRYAGGVRVVNHHAQRSADTSSMALPVAGAPGLRRRASAAGVYTSQIMMPGSARGPSRYGSAMLESGAGGLGALQARAGARGAGGAVTQALASQRKQFQVALLGKQEVAAQEAAAAEHAAKAAPANRRAAADAAADAAQASQGYEYAVARQEGRNLVGRRIPEGIRKLRYMASELVDDLRLPNISSVEFWMQAVLLFITLYFRMFIHYTGQWMLLRALRVPVYAFRATGYNVLLKYVPGVLPFEYEMAVVIAGPLSVVLAMAMCVALCQLLMRLFRHIPESFSRFVAFLGAAAIADPLLVFLVDLIAGFHNCTEYSRCAGDIAASTCTCHEGDAWKLPNRFDQDEGSPLAGIILTVFLYALLVMLGLFLEYYFLLRLHMDGRMLDVYRRLNAPDVSFLVPGDYEVSSNELIDICAKAGRWTGPRGTQRRIAVCEYVATDPLDSAWSSVTTHLVIYHAQLDGTRELYRHFLRMPDGTIIEVFGDLQQHFGFSGGSLADVISHAKDIGHADVSQLFANVL